MKKISVLKDSSGSVAVILLVVLILLFIVSGGFVVLGAQGDKNKNATETSAVDSSTEVEDEQKAEPVKSAEPFTYTNTATKASILIPNGWSLMEKQSGTGLASETQLTSDETKPANVLPYSAPSKAEAGSIFYMDFSKGSFSANTCKDWLDKNAGATLLHDGQSKNGAYTICSIKRLINLDEYGVKNGDTQYSYVAISKVGDSYVSATYNASPTDAFDPEVLYNSFLTLK